MKNVNIVCAIMFVIFLLPNSPKLMAQDVNLPKILDVQPSGDIIPGATRITIVGQNFGTSEENWSGGGATGNITIAGIEIKKVLWTNDKISFLAPEGLAKSYKPNSTNSNYIGIDLKINKQTLFAPVVLRYESVNPPYSDPYLYKQNYLYSIRAFEGWKIQPTGKGVVVAIIDDGIYVNHPDLRENIWVNSREIVGNHVDDDNNGYIDDYYGWNFIANTKEMTTYGSHGTMVAGIIGAEKDNGIGIAGIASGVKLMPLIACGSKGCLTEDIKKAIRYAVDNGADIINMSLGSTGVTNFTNDYDEVIKYAYNKNVLIVAAAGNGDTQGNLGQNLFKIPVSPVCNDNDDNMVLGVSGVDGNGDYLLWANYGKCVDVVAPAYNIFSTAIPDSSGWFYDTESGTSFSTPIVTGFAALLKSKYPTIKNSEIIKLIMNNSENKSEYNGALGNGLINIQKTLAIAFTPASNNKTDNTIRTINNTIINKKTVKIPIKTLVATSSGNKVHTLPIEVNKDVLTTFNATTTIEKETNNYLVFYLIIGALVGIIVGMLLSKTSRSLVQH